jgi:hypothetical protein
MKNVSGFILFTLIFLAACNSDPGSVKILSRGIFEPLTLKFANVRAEGLIDLDEYVKGSEELRFELYVKNNSRFAYQDIDFTFDDTLISAYNFYSKDDDSKEYPGKNGTCTRSLAPGQSCIINIGFFTTKSAVFKQKFSFKYTNEVRAEVVSFEATIISGDPASLVFIPAKTNYTFGDLVGVAQQAFVERSDKLLFQEFLTIKNAGELKARNIRENLSANCRSDITNDCPISIESAFRLRGDCPKILKPNEECNLEITYTATNDDDQFVGLDNIHEYVTFNANFNLLYENDPNQSGANLPAFFLSNSTTIQAKFITSEEGVDYYTGKTIHGNRVSRKYNIYNRGYRSGYLRSLLFQNADGSLAAKCSKASDPEYLQCVDQLGDPKSLESFPFYIKDETGCFVADGLPPFLVEVDQFCRIEVFFQPSVELNDSTVFEYAMVADYDSLWKGQETLRTNLLHKINAASQLPAVLEIQKLSIYGADLSAQIIDATTKEYDAGRVALISANPLFQDGSETTLTIAIKNIGKTRAKSVQIVDGDGVIIPIDGSNLSGIGVHSPVYYKNVRGSSDCDNLQIDKTCNITMTFSPITFGDDIKSSENLYGLGFLTNNYKSFKLSFDDGSLYSDSNIFTENKDQVIKSVEARFKATLVSKGLLQKIDKSSKDILHTNSFRAGNTKRMHIILRNIGTGDISYIGRDGTTPKPMLSNGNDFSYKRSTPGELALYGAHHDCLDVIDLNHDVSITNSENLWNDINNRFFTANPSREILGADESCLLSSEITSGNSMRTDKVSRRLTTADPTVLESFREFSLLHAGTDNLYEFSGFNPDVIFKFIFFDGDNSDPKIALTDNLGKNLGNKFKSSQLQRDILTSIPSKLIVSSALPHTSAIIHRPSISRSALTYVDVNSGLTIQKFAANTIAEKFYFLGTHTEMTPANLALSDLDIFSAGKSLPHVDSVINPSKGVYESIIHFGSFPKNSGLIPLEFKLQEATTATAAGLIEFDLAGGAGQFLDFVGLSSENTVSPPLMSSGSSRAIKFNLDTSVTGATQAVFDLRYRNGLFVNKINASGGEVEVSKRVLIMAEVIEGKDINLTQEEYSVEVQSGAVPLVTLLNNESTVSTTLNNTIGVNSISLSYITSEPKDINSESGFAQKILRFKNTQVSSITNFNVFFMDSLGAVKKLDLSGSGKHGLKVLNNNCGVNATINPASECSLLLRYQPSTTNLESSVILYFSYELQDDQYVGENIKIQLVPISPASLTVQGFTVDTINHPVSASLDSYVLNIGSAIRLTSTEVATKFSNVIIRNTKSTKASFLASYHDYLRSFQIGGYSDLNIPPLSLFPTYNAFGFATFARIDYPSNEGGGKKIELEGQRACFDGGPSQDALLHFNRGFAIGTDCIVNITVYSRLSSIGKTIDKTSKASMGANSIRVKYYNNLRQSTKALTFHIQGRTLSDLVVKINPSDDFEDLTILTNGNLTFNAPTLVANNPSVGNIVGYRLFFNQSKSKLQNIITSVNLDYKDFFTFSDLDGIDMDLSGLLTNNAYYFKLTAIRKHASYVNPGGSVVSAFRGLALDEYISDSNMPILALVVPPSNMTFVYEQRALLDKGRTGVSPLKYNEALSACSTKTTYKLFNGGSIEPKNFRLIDQEFWEFIRENDTSFHNSYGDPKNFAHWIESANLSIDSLFSTVDGFQSSPRLGFQNFPDDELFYYRVQSCFDCPVKMAGGMVNETNYYDYINYLDPSISFAFARCYVDLSGL